MKILQVNSVYRKGSTGKIVYDIHTELQKRGFDSVVCYGRGEMVDEPNVYKTCSELYSKLNNLWSRVTGVMYGGLSCSTRKLIKVIEREKPDIVHLHCINGYFVNIYKIVDYLKKKQIKTVLSLHAEFMHTANCGYAFDCEKWKTGCGQCPRYKQETKSLLFDGTHRSWMLMKRAFEGFGNYLIVTSVSPWLESRAKQSPILSDAKHVTVLNGLDTTVFKLYDKQECRCKFNIPEEKKMVFHATATFSIDRNSIKGGWYVCELAKLMPDVLFVVAGPHADGISVPNNVRLLGRIANQTDLAQLYAAADTTVLASKRETFSMVTAESLCCGTPIVGFKAGAPEEITLPDYSRFVEYGDVVACKEALYDFLSKVWDSVEIEKEAHRKYAREVMTSAYIKVYESIIKRDEQ